MNINPRISIIVPIYNIRAFIERCVNSLITQTYTNLEIILVNDGSTDGSGDIIQQYQSDNRISIINKDNGGLSDARNAGLREITGDYVLFVDGDDYIDNNCIETLLANLTPTTDVIMFPYVKEYKNKSVFCEIFDTREIEFQVTDVQEKIYARLIGPNPSILPVSPVTMNRLNTVWGKLYKKDIINNTQFVDTSLIHSEDHWFNIQVFSNVNNAKYTSKTQYHYEKGNICSFLHKNNINILQKRWNFYPLMEEFLKIRKQYDQYSTNIANRIICEQFGIMLSIVNSSLTESNKRREIYKLLSDVRYVDYYKKAQISKYQFPWSLFFKMCENKDILVVNLLLRIINFLR